MVTLQQLKYFVEMARSGSLARAAQRLHIAQSALSQTLGSLESDFGVKLFERHAKGVQLTSLGAQAFERALILLADFDALQNGMRAGGDATTGTVHLCIAGSLSGLLVAPLLAKLAAEHPHIELLVTDGLSSDVRQQIESGRAQMAVMPGAAELQGIHHQPVLEEPFMFFGAPAVLADVPTRVDLNDVARQALALPDRARDLRKVVERAAAACGAKLEVRYELNSSAMLIAVVKAGLACTILPSSACSDAVAAGVLAVRAIAGPGLCRVQSIVWPDNRPLGGAATAVQRAITHVVETLVLQGELQGRFLGQHHAP